MQQPKYIIVNNPKTQTMKESYINYITVLLKECNDLSLLDLIMKLLEKSV